MSHLRLHVRQSRAICKNPQHRRRKLLSNRFAIWLFMTALCPSALCAQPTVALYNTANSALDDPQIGADFVAGDTFQLSITGATPRSTVTVVTTINGNPDPNNPWTAGQTNDQGDFELTGTESATYVGEYVEQWYVAGIPISPELDFEVIDVPRSLTVASQVLTNFLPDCDGLDYGLMVDVTYNIKNQNGVNITPTYFLMTPYEDIVDYQGNQFHNNVGPVSGYPTSSQWADKRYWYFPRCATRRMCEFPLLLHRSSDTLAVDWQ